MRIVLYFLRAHFHTSSLIQLPSHVMTNSRKLAATASVTRHKSTAAAQGDKQFGRSIKTLSGHGAYIIQSPTSCCCCCCYWRSSSFSTLRIHSPRRHRRYSHAVSCETRPFPLGGTRACHAAQSRTRPSLSPSDANPKYNADDVSRAQSTRAGEDIDRRYCMCVCVRALHWFKFASAATFVWVYMYTWEDWGVLGMVFTEWYMAIGYSSCERFDRVR